MKRLSFWGRLLSLLALTILVEGASILKLRNWAWMPPGWLDPLLWSLTTIFIISLFLERNSNKKPPAI